MEIEDHVALISGGASGLGEATARTIAANGGRVVILDRDEAKGQALAAELGAAARFCRADVTDEAGIRAAVKDALDHFGALHFGICCAGIGAAKRVVGRDGAMPLAEFTRIIDVNLVGTFNTLRLAAEAMMQNEPNADGERGVIVTTASIAAFDGQIGQVAYSASKAAIAGMTLPIARDLAARGIRAVCIAPGLFETPLLGGLSEEAKASLSAQVPFPPRLGQPPEYAAMVKYILNSPMLNGETIRLDGALRMSPS